jgi:hypothetical protein
MSPDHTPIHASPYEWLRKMAVDCCFRPGEQLIIGQLAARLRVSQTAYTGSLDPAAIRGAARHDAAARLFCKDAWIQGDD